MAVLPLSSGSAVPFIPSRGLGASGLAPSGLPTQSHLLTACRELSEAHTTYCGPRPSAAARCLAGGMQPLQPGTPVPTDSLRLRRPYTPGTPHFLCWKSGKNQGESKSSFQVPQQPRKHICVHTPTEL